MDTESASCGTITLAAALVACAGLMTAGCQSETVDWEASAAATDTIQLPEEAPPEAAAGAQLWAQNCLRCHNIRAPASYSDADWQIAMLHMRIQGSLTAQEHEAILKFLKAAN